MQLSVKMARDVLRPCCRRQLRMSLPLAFLVVILALMSYLTEAQQHSGADEYSGEERFILKMGEGETIEERHASWQVLHRQGYSCWLGRRSFASAVCILSHDPSGFLPKTAEGLWRILARVNMRAWLVDVLCGTEDTGNNRSNAGCDELVNRALAASTPEASAILTGVNIVITARATVDEPVWAKALEACTTVAFTQTFQPYECRSLVTVMAIQRATRQILPALRFIQREQQQQQAAHDGEHSTAADASTTSPWIPESRHPGIGDYTTDSGADHAIVPSNGISMKNVQILLDTVAPLTERPSLRMISPKMGGRLSGDMIGYFADVALGSALETRLAAGQARVRLQQNTEQERSGSSTGDSFQQKVQQDEKDETEHGNPGLRHSSAAQYSSRISMADSSLSTLPGSEDDLSPLDHCKVRILVDGKVAWNIPVDPSSSTSPNAQASMNSLPTRTISAAFSPVYQPRCSEHPTQAALDDDAWVRATSSGAPPGAEQQGVWWDNNAEAWYVQARGADRVCTPDVFGPHALHSELVCCATAMTTPTDDRECEVAIKTSQVEYYHTAKGANAPVEMPKYEDGRAVTFDGRTTQGSASAGGEKSAEIVSLLDPISDNISVYLYLGREGSTLGDGGPGGDDVMDVGTVLSVPRWSSDGEVWEAALRACLDVFGLNEGVLVELTDCLDLATTAIKDKRVDLYHRAISRMETYLNDINPEFSLKMEGHTGFFPKKVVALSEVARNNDRHVETICEVGFNAGHSALNWLMNSRPFTRVLAFDLGKHPYVRHSIDYLQTLFPGQLDVILGDSKQTIPAYTMREKQAGRDAEFCNVAFVDGDHREAGAYADLVSFEALANRTWHKLIIDDIENEPVAAAWQRFSLEGRGYMENVIPSKGQHVSQVYDSPVTDKSWEMKADSKNYNIYLCMGHLSLAIGNYLFPPTPPPATNTSTS